MVLGTKERIEMRIHWLRRLLGRVGLAKGAPYVVRHSFGTVFLDECGGVVRTRIDVRSR